MNEDIAGRLDEVASLLEGQGANPFRVRAYRRAAGTLRVLPESAADLFAREGLTGLKNLPHVGESIALAIRDILEHGRLAMLERLRGGSDPLALLETVPGIGPALAHRLHDELGLETLHDLEAAAHDGRLESLAGLGPKRLAGIRDSLAHRLGRVRHPTTAQLPPTAALPGVGELLDVDREYREKSEAGQLQRIAPRRFNPTREAWLPILHTSRGPRHYTALFSNTARAHEAGKTRDWVVLYLDHGDGERQCTVITAQAGPLRGRRLVRGREAECEAYYAKVRQTRGG